jgi:hypothetical protein
MYPHVRQFESYERPFKAKDARSVRRRLSLAIGVLVALITASCIYAAVASAAPQPQSVSACTPGAKTIGGAPARVFCGPAKATVQVGGTTYRFANGACQRAPGFTVNIGTLGFGSSKLSYFGVSLPRAAVGAYTGKQVTVSFNVGARRFSLSPSAGTKVVLAAGLRSGTFSGRDLSGRAVKGSFTC